jgi:hypothetical protein
MHRQHSQRCRFGILVFPDPDHRPAGVSKLAVGVRVPLPVRLDLPAPELGVLLWPGSAERAAVIDRDWLRF